MIRKILKYILFILCTLIITSNNFATELVSDGVIYGSGVSAKTAIPTDEVSKNRFVTKLNNLYYYFDESGVPYNSGDEMRLKRINDTCYFVDNNALIYGKYWGSTDVYKVALDRDLERLIGVELTYANISALQNKTDIINEKITYDKLKANSPPVDYTIYLNNSSDIMSDGIIFIGDSYAYNLMLFGNRECRYSLSPGYAVEDIKNELLDVAALKGVEHCVVFIGPNDLMRQVNLNAFASDLQYIVEFFKNKGIDVTLLNYFNVPDTYNSIDYTMYNEVVKNIKDAEKCDYIDLTDLDIRYKRTDFDKVHPPQEFYAPALEKILNAIKRA